MITIKECCKLMVNMGRVIAHQDKIKIFKKDGSEAKITINNCNGGKPRAYFRSMIEGRDRSLPISWLTWIAHGNKIQEGKTLDHIDRNAMNDSILNLRLATPAEQTQNRGISIATELRNQIKDRFASGTGTIRGMAKEYGFDRTTIADIIKARNAIDRENGVMPIQVKIGKTTPIQRQIFRTLFNFGLGTIRGMSRDFEISRDVMQNIVRRKTFANE